LLQASVGMAGSGAGWVLIVTGHSRYGREWSRVGSEENLHKHQLKWQEFTNINSIFMYQNRLTQQYLLKATNNIITTCFDLLGHLQVNYKI